MIIFLDNVNEVLIPSTFSPLTHKPLSSFQFSANVRNTFVGYFQNI